MEKDRPSNVMLQCCVRIQKAIVLNEKKTGRREHLCGLEKKKIKKRKNELKNFFNISLQPTNLHIHMSRHHHHFNFV